MKTQKIRLLVTIITLAIVTIATIPVDAQRRSTQRSTESRAPERNREFKSTVQRKSTFKNQDRIRRETVNPNLRSTRTRQNKSAQRATRSTNRHSSYSDRTRNIRNSQQAPKKVKHERATISRNSRINHSPTRSEREYNSPRANTQRDAYRKGNSRRQTTSANRSKREYTKSSTAVNRDVYRNTNSRRQTRSSKKQSVNSAPNSRSLQDYTRRSSDVASRSQSRDSRRLNASRTTYDNGNRATTRRSTENIASRNRDFYRLNREDRRYVPKSSYRGSNEYWSRSSRDRVYNKRASRHNYRHNNHWNRSWERYRWSHSSWVDYYDVYQPYWYRQHRHYYHHNHYGHVIRRFSFRPQVFVHNHHNYYCYNGHFFRYRRGIGYILVDVPFGFSFEYLPHGYEKVYINGYSYFRFGNLFFEWDNFAFRLVHYPSRYYAYRDDYCSEGYYFDDDYDYDYYDDYY